MSIASKRFWDGFIIPIVVGLVLALVAYAIPKVAKTGKRLSYTIEKPTNYISEQLQGVTIQVNGTPTTDLFVTKVRLWNSGGSALKDLPVLLYFDTTDANFKILNIAHATRPEREFGSIANSRPDDKSARFVYDLLNRNDEDTISFLTNESAQPTLYAKTEDLNTELVSPNPRAYSSWFTLLAGIIGVAASLLSTFLSWVRTNRIAALRDKLDTIASANEMRRQEQSHLSRPRE